MDFPIRINKYLEEQKIATRRGADLLIEQGKVFVNGKKAVLGYKVKEGDKVEVIGQEQKSYTYLAYNKPRGQATEEIKIKNIFPLGRLDKDSEGLILLTNDGRLTDRLLNPKYEHEKEYEVEVKEKVSPMHAKILTGGIKFERQILRAKEVEIIGPNNLAIVLTEGKKHQIRRMLAGAHLTVESLKRVRIMNIKLGQLAPGQTRELKGLELTKFLNSVGL